MRKIRKEKNIKVKDLKELLNVSEQFYYGLENGTKTLNQEYLEKLADFYQVPVDYILGRSDIVAEEKENYKTNSDDTMKNIFESVSVLRRASKDLSPEAKKKMLELLEDFLKED